MNRSNGDQDIRVLSTESNHIVIGSIEATLLHPGPTLRVVDLIKAQDGKTPSVQIGPGETKQNLYILFVCPIQICDSRSPSIDLEAHTLHRVTQQVEHLVMNIATASTESETDDVDMGIQHATGIQPLPC